LEPPVVGLLAELQPARSKLKAPASASKFFRMLNYLLKRLTNRGILQAQMQQQVNPELVGSYFCLFVKHRNSEFEFERFKITPDMFFERFFYSNFSRLTKTSFSQNKKAFGGFPPKAFASNFQFLTPHY
jgi:hypothetical protein